MRARTAVSSWDGLGVPAIAERLGSHPTRCATGCTSSTPRASTGSVTGRASAGAPGSAKPSAASSRIIALVKTIPPGRPVAGPWLEGLAAADREDQAGCGR